MELVAVADGEDGAYALTIESNPRALTAGEPVRLRLAVHERTGGARVLRFQATHERLFHFFLISQDLEHFDHLHPEPSRDGAFDVDVRLPTAGVYHVIADFLPEGGVPQLLQRSIVTAGYAGPLRPQPKTVTDMGDRVIGDTRVVLSMPEARAGREQLLTFELQQESSRALVRDLEPYLGAPGHLLFLSADGEIAAHSHPVAELAPNAATVVFQVLFPRAGMYRLWAQFQRGGTVLTAAFSVPVSEAE
jgi:hypothetical protein